MWIVQFVLPKLQLVGNQDHCALYRVAQELPDFGLKHIKRRMSSDSCATLCNVRPQTCLRRL